MTLFRSCLLVLIVLLFSSSQSFAHADTFTFTGSADGVSGSVNVTATPTGTGDFLITGIDDPGITLLPPGSFNGNDNLLLPSGDGLVLDSHGFSVVAINGPDTFHVNVFNDGTGNTIFLQDEDNFTTTLPVSFEASSPVPEPTALVLFGTGLLGAMGVVRRRAFSK